MSSFHRLHPKFSFDRFRSPIQELLLDYSGETKLSLFKQNKKTPMSFLYSSQWLSVLFYYPFMDNLNIIPPFIPPLKVPSKSHLIMITFCLSTPNCSLVPHLSLSVSNLVRALFKITSRLFLYRDIDLSVNPESPPHDQSWSPSVWSSTFGLHVL